MKIGFVGTGQMGSRMAKNLLKAGCDLTVNDINKEVRDASGIDELND